MDSHEWEFGLRRDVRRCGQRRLWPYRTLTQKVCTVPEPGRSCFPHASYEMQARSCTKFGALHLSIALVLVSIGSRAVYAIIMQSDRSQRVVINADCSTNLPGCTGKTVWSLRLCM